MKTKTEETLGIGATSTPTPKHRNPILSKKETKKDVQGKKKIYTVDMMKLGVCVWAMMKGEMGGDRKPNTGDMGSVDVRDTCVVQ